KEHTTFHRIQQIASTIGLPVDEFGNSILVVLNNDSEINKRNYHQQLYAEKSMVLESELTVEDIEKHDYVTYFDDKYIYEEYHLDDMFNAFKYTDVDFVTKDNTHEAHNYISEINDKYKTMFDTNAVRNVEDINALNNGYNLDYIEILRAEELPLID